MMQRPIDGYADYFAHLDALRKSGAPNMVGAQPCLEQEFGLTKAEAGEVLVDWMMTFDRDKTPAERDAMVAENKIGAAEVEVALREHEAKYARYFRFLDEFRPAGDYAIGAWVNALAKEFGIGRGEAGAAHMHWLVSATTAIRRPWSELG